MKEITEKYHNKCVTLVRINIMDILQLYKSLDATTFTNGSCSYISLWTLQLLQPKLAFITPLPYYPTVDKFYYLPCPPCYLQWTVTPRSNLQRSTIFYSHLSDQNGFCPTILSTETGGFIQDCQSHCFRGFIQDCQSHSSYHIPHHASSDIRYCTGNDDNLHGWGVSPMQNHTICLRVR